VVVEISDTLSEFSAARFLVLGSASPELLRQSSETLAGRIAFHTLDGFHLEEVGAGELGRLWLRGGFPESFLSRSHGTSFTWRRNFIRTFIERDLPQLGIRVPAATLSRFWSMLAHYHGQVWNASELARSLGVTDKTVRHYLDILSAALVVQQLQPWHATVRKRQVKAPKIYIRDAGLLHALLDIRDRRDLERHPKLGASWEGFLMRQVLEPWEPPPRSASSGRPTLARRSTSSGSEAGIDGGSSSSERPPPSSRGPCTLRWRRSS
jgi:predicted AAA+ superfamily ATPase